MALILTFQVASRKSAVLFFTNVYKKFHKNFQRTSRWLLSNYDFFLQISELIKNHHKQDPPRTQPEGLDPPLKCNTLFYHENSEQKRTSTNSNKSIV